jgi:hypothetical protein
VARNTDAILRDTKETLATARLGLDDLLGADPRRRMSGLRNVAVFGRAVTGVLQNLRSSVGKAEFDEWYLPRQKAMRADELLKYFWNLRNEILKEGRLVTGSSMYLEHLDASELAPVMANPPKGATNFFLGDPLGGSGWEVELPDGTTEKYYVTLPESLRLQIDLKFADPPASHKGEQLQDTSIEALAQHYIAYLEALVIEAQERFGSPQSAG